MMLNFLSKIDYSTALLKKMTNLLKGVFIITVFFIIVPWKVNMPEIDGDSSWAFGLNQAVSQGLVFGKDIIFTFGPYAGISTKQFHPGSDNLTLFAACFLAIAYIVLLLQSFRSASQWFLPASVLLLASDLIYSDIVMLLLPLLLLVATYKMLQFQEQGKKLPLITGAAAIGLIVLIKGTVVLFSVINVCLCTILLFQKRHIKTAILILLVPVVSVVIWWIIAGQPLASLPLYLKNMGFLVSGFTNAMAQKGPLKEVVVYVVTSALIVYLFFIQRKMNWLEKCIFIFSISLFFFISFKAGFVRHDGHAIIAASALLSAGALLLLFGINKYKLIVFSFCGLAFVYIYSHYRAHHLNIARNIYATYANGINGIVTRISGSEYKKMYQQKLNSIQKEYRLPSVSGTADIYSYGQSILLASGNKWSPRPVFQSYAAYTPDLLMYNKMHLLSSKAPDHIFFKIEPLDAKLPSLEDGVSWPLLIENYQIVNTAGAYVHLKKKKKNNQEPQKKLLLSGASKINSIINLPDSPLHYFIEIDINSSFSGKLISTLYQPLQKLELVVKLSNGAEKRVPVVADMMKTGFIISPFVETNDGFIRLFDNNHRYGIQVTSFFLKQSGNAFAGNKTWEPRFNIKINALQYSKQ